MEATAWLQLLGVLEAHKVDADQRLGAHLLAQLVDGLREVLEQRVCHAPAARRAAGEAERDARSVPAQLEHLACAVVVHHVAALEHHRRRLDQRLAPANDARVVLVLRELRVGSTAAVQARQALLLVAHTGAHVAARVHAQARVRRLLLALVLAAHERQRRRRRNGARRAVRHRAAAEAARGAAAVDAELHHGLEGRAVDRHHQRRELDARVRLVHVDLDAVRDDGRARMQALVARQVENAVAIGAQVDVALLGAASERRLGLAIVVVVARDRRAVRGAVRLLDQLRQLAVATHETQRRERHPQLWQLWHLRLRLDALLQRLEIDDRRLHQCVDRVLPLRHLAQTLHQQQQLARRLDRHVASNPHAAGRLLAHLIDRHLLDRTLVARAAEHDAHRLRHRQQHVRHRATRTNDAHLLREQCVERLGLHVRQNATADRNHLTLNAWRANDRQRQERTHQRHRADESLTDLRYTKRQQHGQQLEAVLVFGRIVLGCCRCRRCCRRRCRCCLLRLVGL